MPTEKFDSTMKETLQGLCCSNGWCYGVIWGFDQRNPSLLTLKDAYCGEEMRALIDSMLLQAHVVGRGIIGQAAFSKSHRWIVSDAHHGSFDSLDVSEDDSEFFCQFSVGIKTIAVISVERWGVVEFGSTEKNAEMKDFVDQVRLLFRAMDLEAMGNLDSQFDGIFNDEGFMGEDQSLLLPSQPFPNHNKDLIFETSSSVENPILTSTNPIEQLLLESSNFFDCSATYNGCSMLTPSWPHFSEPRDHEDSILNAPPDLSKDISDHPNLSSSILSGLLTVEEFVASAKADSKSHLENGFSSWSLNPIHKVDNLPTNSLQSSVTNAFRSRDDNGMGVDLGRKKPVFWNESLIQESECISEKDVGSKICNSNSLFSKLGLAHLLDGVSRPSPSYDRSQLDDHSLYAAKRRKVDNFSWSQNQVKLEANNKEDSTKEAQSCIGDRCATDGGKTSSSMRREEAVTAKKKKAKPGTRPRPKDRQMIQDRFAELRELIPNGEKMSIDRLLERTIRHLNFMQSLTRHAESLKQVAKAKSMECLKNQSINGGDGGVTWAYEVGDDAMFCPLIVEDLNTPGQMLIEILCEEQGFFLEIVDIIRSFGLTILKGTMEVREAKKIWAHFMVQAEGSRVVTRHEIFSTLIQLLQMTGQSGGDSYGNVPSSSMPVFEASGSFSGNFGDALQCASL